MSLGHLQQLFQTFYTTSRASAPLLSDGGGPFGFDIQAALQVDALISMFPVDTIVETGTCLGDTTEYLARAYPHLEVKSCELNQTYAEFARLRLAPFSNVQLAWEDSQTFLPSAAKGANCPLVYLDAHWNEDWPLAAELASLDHGIVIIDDFNIGHPRFGYDSYDGVDCDFDFVIQQLPDISRIWIGDPTAPYPYPCLQVGRRSGRAVVLLGLGEDEIDAHAYFRGVSVGPSTTNRVYWGVDA